MAFLQRKPHDGVVHAPHQLVHVLVALIAEDGKAIAFAQQQAALGRYAVERTGMLADGVSGFLALIQPHAHRRLSGKRMIASDGTADEAVGIVALFYVILKLQCKNVMR